MYPGPDLDAPAAAQPTAIVVFDGVCVLCSGWVRFLLRHDRRAQLQFAAMQGETGRALLRGAGLDAGDPVSFLFLRDGQAHTDSDALATVLETLGGAWRLPAGLLRALPRRMRDAAYRALARNRYRLFGRRATCLVPDDAMRARFLP